MIGSTKVQAEIVGALHRTEGEHPTKRANEIVGVLLALRAVALNDDERAFIRRGLERNRPYEPGTADMIDSLHKKLAFKDEA